MSQGPVLPIILVTLLALVHFAAVGRRNGLLTMDSLFVWSQWLMAVGSLALISTGEGAESAYAWVMTLPLTVYVVGSVIVFALLHSNGALPNARGSRIIHVHKPGPVMIPLLVASLAVTALYYRAVGYNTLALGLTNTLTGQDSLDYTTLRLESYGGSRYLFPGYVNQVKNTILPALSIVACAHLFHVRAASRWLITIVLGGATLFALLGTGQRGAFIQFCFVLLAFASFYLPKVSPRLVGTLLLIAAPLLLFVTFLLGRSADSLERASSLPEAVGVLVSELAQRVFVVQQMSGLAAFQYIYDLPTQHGAEWWAALLGVLPGNAGSTLSSDVFAAMYGSSRGSAPISLWGSVFYNAGPLGLLIIPAILAVCYQLATTYGVSRRETSTLELIGMAGSFVVFGMWVAGGPEYPLNAGGFTYAVIWIVARAGRKRSGAADASRKEAAPVTTVGATRTSREVLMR